MPLFMKHNVKSFYTHGELTHIDSHLDLSHTERELTHADVIFKSLR